MKRIWNNTMAKWIIFVFVSMLVLGSLGVPGKVFAQVPSAQMYVTSNFNNTIIRANLDGSGGISLGNLGGTLNNPFGIALDLVGGKMYVANQNNTISRANLDGSGGISLGNLGGTVSVPNGIALDVANGKMYVTNIGNNTISRANLDGSGGTNLGNLNSTLSGPLGIALDVLNCKMYVPNVYNPSASNGTISRANLDGTGGISLGSLIGTGFRPLGIALDLTGTTPGTCASAPTPTNTPLPTATNTPLPTATNTPTSVYNFSGFFQPVDNLPALNSVNASHAIPVKFSLAGNQGLSIFAAGYPVSQQITCDTNV